MHVHEMCRLIQITVKHVFMENPISQFCMHETTFDIYWKFAMDLLHVTAVVINFAGEFLAYILVMFW